MKRFASRISLLIVILCAGCTQPSPLIEQLKTDNGMAALIDEVLSGRAQYLGYQEVIVKGEYDLADIYNNFFNAKDYVEAQKKLQPCAPDEKLKGAFDMLKTIKTIPPYVQKVTSSYEYLLAKVLNYGKHDRFDFSYRIDDTRTLYFTIFIWNDGKTLFANAYAVTDQEFLGTLMLNEYFYLSQSPPPKPLQVLWD